MMYGKASSNNGIKTEFVRASKQEVGKLSLSGQAVDGREQHHQQLEKAENRWLHKKGNKQDLKNLVDLSDPLALSHLQAVHLSYF